MSGMMLHGLGDCTPTLHCGCLSHTPLLEEEDVQAIVRERDAALSRAEIAESGWATCVRQLGEVATEREALAARLAAVRTLHAPVDALHTPTGKLMQVCAACERDGDWRVWPCPTIRALDKETQP